MVTVTDSSSDTRSFEDISSLLLASRLDAILRTTAPEAWDRVLDLASYVSARYLPTMVDYQNEYARGGSEWLRDLSMVLRNDGEPVAVWPLWLRRTSEGVRLGSNEGPVMSPLFRADMSEKTTKLLAARCLNFADALCRENGIAQWTGVQPLHGIGLDFWHRMLMERGASTRAVHECYVDLSRPIEDLRLGVRKSFRPLISKARQLWQWDLWEQLDEALLIEMMNLHRYVAGRITRSHTTWELQRTAVNRKQAFVITLRDGSTHLVGFGLFHVSRDESIYGVAAYDRSLFAQPLGHLVQMLAIEYVHRRGVRWHRLGDRPYPADQPTPSDKELAIAYFKEAFATHWSVRLMTTYSPPLQGDTTRGRGEAISPGGK